MDTIEETYTKVKAQFSKACDEFRLIEEGDRIMVGLSGGKDSLLLSNFLAIFRDEHPGTFEVICAHIKFDNLPYSVDGEYLEKFCADRKIEYFLVTDQIREAHLQKGTCLHCSHYRRAKLMELCRLKNCNKLALGHHLDDIVATLLMSMTQHGRFGGMAVKLPITVGEFKYPLTIIRPLCYTPEQDIIDYNAAHNYKPTKCRCPWGDAGQRSKTREAEEILCQIGPNVRLNLFKSQFNVHEKQIGQAEQFEIEECDKEFRTCDKCDK